MDLTPKYTEESSKGIVEKSIVYYPLKHMQRLTQLQQKHFWQLLDTVPKSKFETNYTHSIAFALPSTEGDMFISVIMDPIEYIDDDTYRLDLRGIYIITLSAFLDFVNLKAAYWKK